MTTETAGDPIKKAPSAVWEDVDLKNSPSTRHNTGEETDPLVKKTTPGELAKTEPEEPQPRCKKAVWLVVGIPAASLALAGGSYLLWYFFG